MTPASEPKVTRPGGDASVGRCVRMLLLGEDELFHGVVLWGVVFSGVLLSGVVLL